jgi:acid phosphatase family membrane protein YuiD
MLSGGWSGGWGRTLHTSVADCSCYLWLVCYKVVAQTVGKFTHSLDVYPLGLRPDVQYSISVTALNGVSSLVSSHNATSVTTLITSSTGSTGFTVSTETVAALVAVIVVALIACTGTATVLAFIL